MCVYVHAQVCFCVRNQMFSCHRRIFHKSMVEISCFRTIKASLFFVRFFFSLFCVCLFVCLPVWFVLFVFIDDAMNRPDLFM